MRIGENDDENIMKSITKSTDEGVILLDQSTVNESSIQVQSVFQEFESYLRTKTFLWKLLNL